MQISEIEMNPLLAFFTTFGIFTFGYLISTITVGYLSYVPLADDDDDDDLEYENMISNNFINLNDVDLSDNYVNDLKNKFSREMTFNGEEVIMCYNNETESFNYWSNTKNVYFSTLELLSKKYVIDYNCKKLYQYTKPEQPGVDAEQPGVDAEQPGVDAEQPGDKINVFANFKKYNKTKNKIDEVVKNRYSYRGKIDDWELDIKKTQLKEDIADSINYGFSFKNFKNINK